MVIEVDVLVNHVFSFGDCSRLESMQEFSFQHAEEIFCTSIIPEGADPHMGFLCVTLKVEYH